MSSGQLLVMHFGAALLLAVLVGIVATGRIWLCRTFGLWVLAALTSNRLIAWWPERFYTQEFWTLKEGIYAILVVGIALELAAVAFMAFPHARRVATLAILSVVAVGIAALALGPSRTYSDWIGVVIPRMGLAGGWSLLVVVAVATWYKLPLVTWHRTIALGFVMSQGVYAALMAVVVRSGWSMYPYVVALMPAADTAIIGLWAFGAWRSGAGELSVIHERPVEDESGV